MLWTWLLKPLLFHLPGITVIMGTSWLQALGIQEEVQNTIEDLSSEGMDIFNTHTDDYFYLLKDSIASL